MMRLHLAFPNVPRWLMASLMPLVLCANAACADVQGLTPPSCTYGASADATSFAAAGGPGTVSVKAASVCGWTAESSAPWVTFAQSPAGAGDGRFAFTVGPNTTTAGRTATIKAAGATIPITQSGIACVYSLSSASATFEAGGGNGSFEVTTDAACSWTAASSAPWITIADDARGMGRRVVSYAVDRNPNTSGRTAQIAVGDKTVVVSQAGAAAAPPPSNPAPPVPDPDPPVVPPPPTPPPSGPTPPPCSYSVGPLTASLAPSGGSGDVTVTTSSGCAWTAISNASWITITKGTATTGPGTMTYAVAANGTSSSRTGTLTVAGNTVTITQAGQPCTYTVMPQSKSFDKKAHNDRVNVNTAAPCGWTATSDASWLTISPASASGTGPGQVDYAMTPNDTGAERSATITIATQSVTITQRK